MDRTHSLHRIKSLQIWVCSRLGIKALRGASAPAQQLQRQLSGGRNPRSA